MVQNALQQLFLAIDEEDTARAKFILQQNPSLNLNQSIGEECDMTLLHYAAGLNLGEIIQALIDHGADPNSKLCADRITPLHVAALYSQRDSIQVLLKAGASPFFRDGDGKSTGDIFNDNDLNDVFDNMAVSKKNPNRLTICPRKSFRMSIGVGNVLPKARSERNLVAITEDDESSFNSSVNKSNNMTPNLIPPQSNAQTNKNASSTATFFQTPSGVSSSTASSNTAQIENHHDFNANKTSTTPGISETTTMPTDDSFIDRGIDISSSASTTITTIASSSISITSSTVITESEVSNTDSGRSTPPPPPTPTKAQIETMKAIVANSPTKLRIPVTASTYNTVSKYVDKEAQMLKIPASKTQWSPELSLGLRKLNLINDWGSFNTDLYQSGRDVVGRRNLSKSYFNYVLLDPKLVKRTNFSGNHLKSDEIIKNVDKFVTFLTAIFYIGKGKGSRPLQHLVDAKTEFGEFRKMRNRTVNSQPVGGEEGNEKIEQILEIWRRGEGVLVHSIFPHSTELEANVNEAAMIDSIGHTENLSNIIKGSYGNSAAAKWSQKKKNQYGAFLLYKAYSAFVVSTPKSFYPHDF